MATRKWRDIRSKKLSKTAQQRVDARVHKDLLEMDLRAMRELLDVTQEHLAELLEKSQAVVSRMEGRDDHLISTLRRYVEALGGQLEVHAVFDDKTVRLHSA